MLLTKSIKKHISYVGYTNNLSNRLKKHNSSSGAKFTKGRKWKIIYSKKYQGLQNYLVANRSVGTFSLTTSLVASALGAWILFGPASAATWGGIGAVIGYSLGTAFPLFVLIYLGQIFRNKYPKARSLIEVVRLRFGSKLFKLILFLSIFYMTIFLIAEVTAVSILINYISGTDLWITAFIVILSSLLYTLYGGLRASIFTDLSLIHI